MFDEQIFFLGVAYASFCILRGVKQYIVDGKGQIVLILDLHLNIHRKKKPSRKLPLDFRRCELQWSAVPLDKGWFA